MNEPTTIPRKAVVQAGEGVMSASLAEIDPGLFHLAELAIKQKDIATGLGVNQSMICALYAGVKKLAPHHKRKIDNELLPMALSIAHQLIGEVHTKRPKLVNTPGFRSYVSKAKAAARYVEERQAAQAKSRKP